MSGLSDSSVSTLPVQAPRPGGATVAAIVIESPIPASRSTQSERTARRAVKPVPTIADRRPSRSAGPQDGGQTTRTAKAEQPGQTGAIGSPFYAPRAGLAPQFSAPFVAQILGQENEAGAETEPAPSEPQRLRGHDAYRRSGGEPPLFPEEPALFSVAV